MKFTILALLAMMGTAQAAPITIGNMTSGGNAQAGDIAPVVRGGLNNFKITLSTAASKAASDNSKGTVASVAGPTTVDHVATFNDSAGTIKDGGSAGALMVTTTGGFSPRSLSDHFNDVVNAADYGVVCDGIQLTDLNVTTGTNTVVSEGTTFTTALVGYNAVVTDTNDTTILNTTVANASGGNLILAANWSGGSLTNHTGRITLYKTDNTAAIARAILAGSSLDNLGHNQRGFRLNFPNGVCATKAITQPRLSVFSCAGGVQACTLFEISGTNTDFIKSENFDVLTGTGLNYGPTGTYNGKASDNRVPTHFGLEDIHLDCNKLGQSSGRCVAYYGAAMMLKGQVLLDHAKGDCLFTEMSDAPAWSLTDWKSYEEGDFSGTIKTRNCGRYGWLDRGNKDANIGVFIDAESASTGFRNEISAGLYAGTIDYAGLIHGYAETDHTSAYFGAPANIANLYLDYANGEINTSAFSVNHINSTACGFGGVTCLKVDNGTTNVTVNSADFEFYPGVTGIIALDVEGQLGQYSNIFMSGLNPGINVTGIKVGNAFNTFTGLQVHNMTATGDTCIYLGAGSNLLNGVMFSCYNFIDATADGGLNIVDLSMYKAGGTNYKTAAAFAASDYLRISHDDGTYVSQNH